MSSRGYVTVNRLWVAALWVYFAYESAWAPEGGVVERALGWRVAAVVQMCSAAAFVLLAALEVYRWRRGISERWG